MKRKSLIVGLILILFFAMLAVSTAEVNNVNDCNSTIPDGYHIRNSTDDYVLLESDKYHTISISVMESMDSDVLKYMLERSMYDFTYCDNYTKGSYVVEENHYNQEYQSGILYLCDNGEELLVIDYKVPLGEDLEDSPVDVILDSLP